MDQFQTAVRVLFESATICGSYASSGATETFTGVVQDSTAHAGELGAIATTPTNTLRTRATTTRWITTRLGSNNMTVSPSIGGSLRNVPYQRHKPK